MITSLGGIGVGIVWGWLAGKFDSQVDRPYTVWLSVLGATLLIAAEIFWLAGIRPAIYFLCAMPASLFFHSQWRKQLRKQQS